MGNTECPIVLSVVRSPPLDLCVSCFCTASVENARSLFSKPGSSSCCLVTQSCLTLCDPMDCSPSGTSIHGDSPGKKTGVGYHSLLQGISPNQGSNPGLSKEHPGLISRMDWLDLLARDSQESSPTPQFKSIILRCSAFFTVQLSHPYMTTGKTIALTRRTFVGKECLCFCHFILPGL